MVPHGTAESMAGLSLVEIMVALVVGLVLTAGVLQIFEASKASYRMNDGVAHVQESGRFAVNVLSQDIRMAGYQGCLNRDELKPKVLVASPPADLLVGENDAITGVDNVSAGNTYGAKAGTDVLIVRGASRKTARLSANMGSTDADLSIEENPGALKTGDYLFITDCAKADVFKASSVTTSGTTTTIAHNGTGNTSSSFSKAYDQDALTMAFRSDTYYVADDGSRTNEAGEPVYSLFVRHLDGTTEELVEGVENMQVEYGVDTNGDGSVDEYDNAGAGPAFANVIAVRVGLLVSSVDHATSRKDTTTTYKVLDETVGPLDDWQLRKVFTLTAAVRNRELRSVSFN